MNMSKKLAFIGSHCVACGCCVLICPKHAIRIKAGIRASVDKKGCVGCGKCADICPGAVITMMDRGYVK